MNTSFLLPVRHTNNKPYNFRSRRRTVRPIKSRSEIESQIRPGTSNKLLNLIERLQRHKISNSTIKLKRTNRPNTCVTQPVVQKTKTSINGIKICSAIKLDGKQCTAKAKYITTTGKSVCGRHKK